MHIAIVNLTRGGFSGGYRKYLRALVPLLRIDERVSRLDLYLPETQKAVNVEADVVKTWPAQDDRYAYAQLKRWLSESRPDVVFIPTARTLSCSMPVVSMIRNMEPLLVPFDGNVWAEGIRNLARAWVARRAAARSDRVIAVSQSVRDFLVSRWQVDPRKIGVVYHGVERVAGMRRPRGADGLEPGTFLFTAGSIRPARGLDDLIDGLAEAARRGVAPDLVIAGEPDPGTHSFSRAIRTRAQDLGLGSRIRWLGRLDDEEMAWCFANCLAFVMTSRAEACPNTVLEALAQGTLSISTDCPPMPEFFGDAALYYSARDAGSLADRIVSLEAMNESDADALRARARLRACAFTWEGTASETLTQLELAIR